MCLPIVSKKTMITTPPKYTPKTSRPVLVPPTRSDGTFAQAKLSVLMKHLALIETAISS
jgi:hypothetical protein